MSWSWNPAGNSNSKGLAIDKRVFEKICSRRVLTWWQRLWPLENSPGTSGRSWLLIRSVESMWETSQEYFWSAYWLLCLEWGQTSSSGPWGLSSLPCGEVKRPLAWYRIPLQRNIPAWATGSLVCVTMGQSVPISLNISWLQNRQEDITHSNT